MKKVNSSIFSLIIALNIFYISCEKHDDTPDALPEEISDSSFTFGVWLQSPEQMAVNNKTNAQNYKDIGINTFIGLHNWPGEHNMYPGYAVAAMTALKETGMILYTGNDTATINWISAHPEFAEILVGYTLGDEPEMFKINQTSPGDQWQWAQPDTWKKAGEALHAADPSRKIYANFGKGFAKYPWTGYRPTTTMEEDFANYVSPLSLYSCDFYGITDPWEAPENHGIWTYGRSVRNAKISAGSRPVWGFIEASCPWRDNQGNPANQMYKRMQPDLIMPIIWNMVVNGAQGIVYFCHDFSSSALGSAAAIREPGIPEAIKAANESVKAYGAVLLSGTNQTGTTVSTNGSVDVIALTKKYNEDIYIFAMSDGNSSYRDGQAVDAVITIEGQSGTKNVAVLNDSRNISMADGKINDHFDPYELHIYKIDN